MGLLRPCHGFPKPTKQTFSIPEDVHTMRHNVLRSWVNGESSPGKSGQTKLHLKTLLVVYPERCHQSPRFRVTPLHCAKAVYPGGLCHEATWFSPPARRARARPVFLCRRPEPRGDGPAGGGGGRPRRGRDRGRPALFRSPGGRPDDPAGRRPCARAGDEPLPAPARARRGQWPDSGAAGHHDLPQPALPVRVRPGDARSREGGRGRADRARLPDR